MLNRIIHIASTDGILPLLRAAMVRVGGRGKPVEGFDQLRSYFEGKHGLEIGGPSGNFMDKSLLPVYRIVGSCDNCNFSNRTVWQGDVQEGLEFKYHRNKPAGYQFICEATDLARIGNERYDFVISSGVIEHIANPLKAILEWKMVLRVGGVVLLLCPHKEATFDHRRPITPLSHLIDDFNERVDDRDLTHLPEILKLHDLSLDPEAGSYEQFLARSQKNFDNRCLHQHVFVTESWITILDHLNLEIVCLKAVLPLWIVVVGKKVDENAENLRSLHASNLGLLEFNAEWRQDSPFRLDKGDTGIGS